jgi:hypothetical protein
MGEKPLGKPHPCRWEPHAALGLDRGSRGLRPGSPRSGSSRAPAARRGSSGTGTRCRGRRSRSPASSSSPSRRSSAGVRRSGPRALPRPQRSESSLLLVGLNGGAGSPLVAVWLSVLGGICLALPPLVRIQLPTVVASAAAVGTDPGKPRSRSCSAAWPSQPALRRDRGRVRPGEGVREHGVARRRAATLGGGADRHRRPADRRHLVRPRPQLRGARPLPGGRRPEPGDLVLARREARAPRRLELACLERAGRS